MFWPDKKGQGLYPKVTASPGQVVLEEGHGGMDSEGSCSKRLDHKIE